MIHYHDTPFGSTEKVDEIRSTFTTTPFIDIAAKKPGLINVA